MIKSKIVYFFRHGQSEHNVSPVFQAPNSPLSKVGREQAKKIALRASKLKIEAIISSPLPRAKETAIAISEHISIPVTYESIFEERIKPNSIDGKPYTDIEASKVWREWETSLYTPGKRVQDGENYDEILKRANEALDYLRNRPEHCLAVVTHGYFLRTIIAKVLLAEKITGPAFKHLQQVAWMENTGLTVLRYEPGFEEDYMWRLWTYNDISHLGDI